MANGDRAAAVGMDTVAGTDDIRQGYDEVNKSRDYLADHRTDGTHPASAISSGTLPVARGGTGRGNLFDTVTDANPDPVAGGLRLLAADENNHVYAVRNGVLDPRYLGFQIHAGVWTDVSFNEGSGSEPHGAGFMPIVVLTQALLNPPPGATTVIVAPRAQLPSWDETNVVLRAFITETGAPYDGGIARISYIAIGAA